MSASPKTPRTALDGPIRERTALQERSEWLDTGAISCVDRPNQRSLRAPGLVRSSGETAHQLIRHRRASLHSPESMQRCVLPVQPTVARYLGVYVGALLNNEGARDASRRELSLQCPALLLRRHRTEN